MSPTWTVDRERILTAAEIRLVLDQLRRKARRSPLTRRNLVIFRLATCCGLRVSELCGLVLDNVRLGARPSIRIPKTLGKGGKARTVPLDWDRGTLEDLKAWKAERQQQGANGTDLFVQTNKKTAIDRVAACRAFQSVCKPLGRHVTIHDGRHSYISHALARGHNIVAVRDSAGHSNLSTTSIYAHLVSDDDGVVGDMF